MFTRKRYPDLNTANYVRNSHYFDPVAGQPVVVFEFWRTDGELVRDCVPEAYAYHAERLRKSWREVGKGVLVHPCSAVNRWGDPIWTMNWDRAAETPAFEYGDRWHFKRAFYRTLNVIRVARHIDTKTARYLLTHGYITGKMEFMVISP